MKVKSTAKYIRTSPRKARLVADLIRNRRVDDAIAVLRFTNKGVAPDFLKVVRSAVADAENNYMLDARNLYISAAYADDGPSLKRGRIGSRGRFKPYVKRTSHLTVEVDELPEPE